MKPPEEATAWAPGSANANANANARARDRAGTLPARGRGRDRKLTRKKSMAARALTSLSQTVVASPKSSKKEVVLPPCTVWVGNVPFSKATEETLREVFEAYGEIKKLTVRQKPYKDGSNEHKSWAYVTFAGTDAMIRAVESSSWLQDEHDERVELIKQLPRTGPRSPGGAASTIIAARHGDGMDAKKRWTKIAESRQPDTASLNLAGKMRSAIMDGKLSSGEGMSEALKRQSVIEKGCFFLPDYPFRKFCDVLMVIAMLYVAVVYPVNEGFSVQPAVGSFVFYVDVLVDIWFALDLVLNFRTAVFYTSGRDRNVLEIDPNTIAKQYLKGWFFVDFLSCLPVNYVSAKLAGRPDQRTSGVGNAWRGASALFNLGPRLCAGPIGGRGGGSGSSTYKMLKVLRLIRLVRLLRLARFVKLLSKYEDTVLRDLLESTGILMNCLFILWLTHLLACTWYYTGIARTTARQVVSDLYSSVTHLYSSGLVSPTCTQVPLARRHIKPGDHVQEWHCNTCNIWMGGLRFRCEPTVHHRRRVLVQAISCVVPCR